MIRREMRHSFFFCLLFLDNPDYLIIFASKEFVLWKRKKSAILS